MDAVTLLSDGTMKAAALMIGTGRFPALAACESNRRAELVTGAIRQILKAGFRATLAEWREALDANLPESALRHIVNVECNAKAAEACRIVEDELSLGVALS